MAPIILSCVTRDSRGSQIDLIKRHVLPKWLNLCTNCKSRGHVRLQKQVNPYNSMLTAWCKKSFWSLRL